MNEETWMNANKALELGFADDLLKDDKRQQTDSSYSFSGKRAETKLLNLITEKLKTDVSMKGTRIAELEKRLELLK